MARLIGERQDATTAAESFMYDYVMRELPDYIYARFDFMIGERELALVLFVPHLGVLILDIHGGMNMGIENGELYMTDRTGMKRYLRSYNSSAWENPDVRALSEYLYEKFGHIRPFVYHMYCFPFIDSHMDIFKQAETFNADRILFKDDLDNYQRLLIKMQLAKLPLTASVGRNGGVFSDLTDVMAHNIFYYFETGMEAPARPPKPPLVFLSHSSKNGVFASEIKADLEKRGIYVWRAPEDVPQNEYYKDIETKALEDSDAFLFLLSSSSQASLEVKYEFDLAIEKKKIIIPIKIEDFDVNEEYTEALSHIQYRLMTRLDPFIMDEIEHVIRNKG